MLVVQVSATGGAPAAPRPQQQKLDPLDSPTPKLAAEPGSAATTRKVRMSCTEDKEEKKDVSMAAFTQQRRSFTETATPGSSSAFAARAASTSARQRSSVSPALTDSRSTQTVAWRWQRRGRESQR